MSAAWHFYQQKSTDPIHNPISGEFFSTESVGNVMEAVVREGIQNTLDARRKCADGSREPARVRVFVSGLEGALQGPRARHWFESLWPHVTAPNNGLRSRPSLSAGCPFLVFEDF